MKSLSRSQPGISSLEAIEGQKGWCSPDASLVTAELLGVKSGTVEDDDLVASLTMFGVESSRALKSLHTDLVNRQVIVMECLIPRYGGARTPTETPLLN